MECISQSQLHIFSRQNSILESETAAFVRPSWIHSSLGRRPQTSAVFNCKRDITISVSVRSKAENDRTAMHIAAHAARACMYVCLFYHDLILRVIVLPAFISSTLLFNMILHFCPFHSWSGLLNLRWGWKMASPLILPPSPPRHLQKTKQNRKQSRKRFNTGHEHVSEKLSSFGTTRKLTRKIASFSDPECSRILRTMSSRIIKLSGGND